MTSHARRTCTDCSCCCGRHVDGCGERPRRFDEAELTRTASKNVTQRPAYRQLYRCTPTNNVSPTADITTSLGWRDDRARTPAAGAPERERERCGMELVECYVDYVWPARIRRGMPLSPCARSRGLGRIVVSGTCRTARGLQRPTPPNRSGRREPTRRKR